MCVCVVFGMEALADLCTLGVPVCVCVSKKVRGPWPGGHLGHLGSLVTLTPTCHIAGQATWMGHWIQSAYPYLPGPQFPNLCNGCDHPCPAGRQEWL